MALVAPFSSLTNTIIPGFVPMWVQLNDDGTNWNVSIGFDGTTFIKILTEARNSFLTATQLVVAVSPNGAIAGAVFDSFA
jgi:hypothetical protein